MIRLAILNPAEPDGLARTIIDGMLGMQEEVEFRLATQFDYPLPTKRYVLGHDDLIRYAKGADLIILTHAKRGMQRKLADEIGAWEKTVYLDGSEPGKNRRLDPTRHAAILEGTFTGTGSVDWELHKKCALYFRRERPYPPGILPLPFGIESRYRRYAKEGQAKPTDFVCVFGQEAYPPLRREVRLALEAFCKERGFTCVTQKTWTQNGFYKKLARAKVGISVSGGGFDSFRFWETLGNDCLLLTETVDIEVPTGTTLAYERIYQFSDLVGFKAELEKLSVFLREGYKAWDRSKEYEQIITEHSTASRVRYLLAEARRAGLLA